MKKLILSLTLFIGVSTIFLSDLVSFDLSDLFSPQELAEFNKAMGGMFQGLEQPARPAAPPRKQQREIKKEVKSEPPQDEKTLFLNDCKAEQLTFEVKKAYNTYMQKITDLLKSIENKATQVIPETIIVYATDVINPLVSAHGEIKNQDEGLLVFFSSKMNPVRKQLFESIGPLQKLDQQLNDFIKLKQVQKEAERATLKQHATEAKALTNFDKKKQSSESTSGRRAGSDSSTELSEEHELQFFKEEPKKIDSKEPAVKEIP
jgi:hypothetical protein